MVNFLAIDFGTTKIAAALINNGRADVVELDNGNEMPTAIYINGDTIRYGRAAMIEGKRDPENLYVGLKGIVGRSFTEAEFSTLKKRVQYNIRRCRNGRCILLVKKGTGRVEKSPTDLVAMILKHVLEVVKKRGFEVDGIMVGYPPSFKEPQIREICAATARTGVEHVDMVAETSAACLFSGISPLMTPGNTLVIDCGGGTIDFSVINTDKGGFDVMYTYGLPELGGVDFTTAIENKLIEDLKLQNVDVLSFSKRDRFRLRESIEETKVNLKAHPTGQCVYYPSEDSDGNFYITESFVQAACHRLLKQCENALKKVLDEMKKNNAVVDRVVLSGGGMNLRCLSERLCGILQVENTTMNYEQSVVRGIAYAAQRVAPKHVPGDDCLLTSLDPQTPESSLYLPEVSTNTPIPESPFPDTPIPESPFPFLPPTMPQPAEDSDSSFEESPTAALWVSQHPVRPQAEPDEEMLNDSRFTIKEKRAYNIYTKTNMKLCCDLKLLIDKQKELPFTAVPYPFKAGSSGIKLTLYEGLEPVSSKCTAIRQVVFECDAQHERLIRQVKEAGGRDYPKLTVYVTADRKSLLSFKAMWEDTKETLKIVADRPVPPDYRQASQRRLNGSAEQSESQASTPRAESAAIPEVTVERRALGMERVLPTPVVQSFDQPHGSGISVNSLCNPILESFAAEIPTEQANPSIPESM